MKNLFFLCALVLSSCTAAPDFSFELEWIEEEVSEDSNSVTQTLEMEGYRGTYHWVYEGYHPSWSWDKNRKYSFKLTEEEWQELTLLIRENGLMVPREETVSSGEPWSAFTVTWKANLEGQTAEGLVVGEPISSEEWGFGSQKEEMIDESVFAAEAVFSFVKEKVEFEY